MAVMEVFIAWINLLFIVTTGNFFRYDKNHGLNLICSLISKLTFLALLLIQLLSGCNTEKSEINQLPTDSLSAPTTAWAQLRGVGE